MEDAQIIELFFARSEDAISELDKKYGKLCHKLADNILASAQDAEECVNDAYLSPWNAIPPQRPESLPAFVGTQTIPMVSSCRKRALMFYLIDGYMSRLSAAGGALHGD